MPKFDLQQLATKRLNQHILRWTIILGDMFTYWGWMVTFRGKVITLLGKMLTLGVHYHFRLASMYTNQIHKNPPFFWQCHGSESACFCISSLKAFICWIKSTYIRILHILKSIIRDRPISCPLLLVCLFSFCFHCQDNTEARTFSFISQQELWKSM